MAFGQRVLIPVNTQPGTESDQNPFSRFCASAHRQGYREMRMIGGTEFMPCAVVLGLLEFAAQKTSATLGPIIREKLRDDIFQKVLDFYEEARKEIPTADFMNDFVSKCCFFLDSEGINRNTDAALSNIFQMCEVFKTTVEVLNEGMDEVSKIGKGVATIGIGVARRMCFVLYPTLTRDSFIILPCRHLQLRYVLYQKLRKGTDNRAISDSDQVKTDSICKICNLQYRPDMFPFLLDFTKQTVAQQLQPEKTDELVCRSCYRGLEAAEVSNLCGCSETVCVNCMIIARADKYPSFCPGCSNQISVTSGIESQATKNPNLKAFLPKDWGQGKVIQTNTKRCSKCNKLQDIEAYVSFGVHLNCWTCSACVLANLQTRSPCTHCHLHYDSSNPKIHEISTQIEERKAPMSNPRNNPVKVASKQEMSHPLAVSSPLEENKEQHSAEELPSDTPPLTVEDSDPLSSIDTKCEICKQPILDSQPIRLEDDKCRVCRKCLVQYYNPQQCVTCKRPYSARDRSTIETLIRAPQSTFVCSKCKQSAPADRQHLCFQNKRICIDCCIENVILTHTNHLSTCRDCRNNILQEMQIDLETAAYECAGCHEMKTLLQIAHRCSKKGMLCPRCVKFTTKARAVQCPHCKDHIHNKYFNMSKQQP